MPARRPAAAAPVLADPFLGATSTPRLDCLVVGLPCTYSIGGDSYAHVIVEIRRNGRQIVLGHPNDAERAARILADCTARGEGDEFAQRLIEQGRKVLNVGRDGTFGGRWAFVRFGEAAERRDPSF